VYSGIEVEIVRTYRSQLSLHEVRRAHDKRVQVEVTQATANGELAIGAAPALTANESTSGADALLFGTRFVIDCEAHDALGAGENGPRVTDIGHEQSSKKD
jgi:hypothetical protein